MKTNIATIALEAALSSGMDGVRITQSEGLQRAWSLLSGKPDRLQYAAGASLSIQLYQDGRYGSFSTNRLEREDVEAFVRRAADSVRLLTPDSAYRMPDPALLYRGDCPDLGQSDPNFDAIPEEAKKQLLHTAAQELLSRPKSALIASEVEFGESQESCYILDSCGFEGRSAQTYYTLSAECSIRGKDDEKPQGWWYEAAQFFDQLQPEGCGNQAWERAVRMLDPRPLPGGNYSVILENTVSSRLLSPVLAALSGASIYQQNSFLMDSLDKQLFSQHLTLLDEPLTYGAMGSRYFDSEGLATKPRQIIDQGVVRTWFLNTYTATKLAMQPTIEGISVPVLQPFGPETAAEMMQELDRGVLITSFNGGNSNGATGDFSFGIEGIYFENGQPQYPIREMNISGNLLSLWSRICAVGKDSRQAARWRIPSLAFEGVSLQ